MEEHKGLFNASAAISRRRKRWLPSTLEKLPQELLEKIFLETLNTNLLEASPYIASRLSSEYVRKETLIRTCSSHSPASYPSAISRLFPGDKEIAKVQNHILRARWFTISFLRHCIPEYMTKTLVRELSFNKLHWLKHDGPLVTPQIEATIRGYVDKLFNNAISKSFHNEEVNAYTEIEWEELETNQRIHLGLGAREGLVSLRIYKKPTRHGCKRSRGTQVYSRFRILCLSHQSRIPTKLLHGPWFDEKCELLDIIIKGNASIDWMTTTSGETAQEGFWEALRTNNTCALRTLLARSNGMCEGERKDMSYPMTSTPKGVGIDPEQKHLIYAIQHGCKEDVIELLINAPGNKVDLQHQDVSALILSMRAHNHPQTSWLEGRKQKDLIMRLSTFRDHRDDNTPRFPPPSPRALFPSTTN